MNIDKVEVNQDSGCMPVLLADPLVFVHQYSGSMPVLDCIAQQIFEFISRTVEVCQSLLGTGELDLSLNM